MTAARANASPALRLWPRRAPLGQAQVDLGGLGPGVEPVLPARDRRRRAGEVVVVDAVGDEAAGPVADRRLHALVGHRGSLPNARPGARSSRGR